MADDPYSRYLAAKAACVQADAAYAALTQQMSDADAARHAAKVELEAASAAMASAGGATSAQTYNGSGQPSDTLGVDGDYYLDDVTGDLYQKAGGTWF